ncbi:efflux RND transporter periplasmic adaptor subunit [Roseisolibacter sp. H3M3-2]|uniref:efflux RND transporter periplasmic adaptor subunit n=1 Tax=Roseisolibacter sp. H3M3-2 TaxID=3031323 RepID=UPI0023DACC22|nr:efflux RND transporter periplasmic adaptor subunit [Roseisolibacter sp. H3M3-2]MDF1503175.1 efflux RND transporter periplasmic adaptor subunit [Roseisolibacter sp. H3M3-2]
MSSAPDRPAARRRLVGSVALLGTVVGTGGVLAAWKNAAAGEAAAGAPPEPVETVVAATAAPREHRATTSAIGTVLATRSVTLRNELPGTVRAVALRPGQIVEPGTVLVALDVSVERAELEAQRAQARLAQTLLARTERMAAERAASTTELDQARAEQQVALAQIARIEALIARKTIRAPFRARVGIADVHVGQFLDAGTVLTTLQGIDGAAHVDFSVNQAVAAALRPGQALRVLAAPGTVPVVARVVAVDARVDPETRTAAVRARVADADRAPAPGASVRVETPVGETRDAVAVPASALRKGPAGEHVFVIAPDSAGVPRARLRAVRAGPLVGDEVVIVDGLRPGERVAAAGSFKLHDAARVVTRAATRAATNVTTR